MIRCWRTCADTVRPGVRVFRAAAFDQIALTMETMRYTVRNRRSANDQGARLVPSRGVSLGLIASLRWRPAMSSDATPPHGSRWRVGGALPRRAAALPRHAPLIRSGAR